MNRNQFEEIIRFCIVGGLSFLVDYGLLYIGTEYIGLYYLWSSAGPLLFLLRFPLFLITGYVLSMYLKALKSRTENKLRCSLAPVLSVWD